MRIEKTGKLSWEFQAERPLEGIVLLVGTLLWSVIVFVVVSVAFLIGLVGAVIR